MPLPSSSDVKIFSVDTERIRRSLRDLVDSRYARDPNVVAVVLFGSFARGDAVPGSDVDLLVVVNRDARPPRDRIPDLLPGAFPVGIDVVPLTRAELDARLSRNDRFVRTVLAEGEVLFDRTGLLARRERHVSPAVQS